MPSGSTNDCLTLKMKVQLPFERSTVTRPTTRRHIPKDWKLHNTAVKTSNFATQGKCPLFLIQSGPVYNLNENKNSITEYSGYRNDFDRNISDK